MSLREEDEEEGGEGEGEGGEGEGEGESQLRTERLKPRSAQKPLLTQLSERPVLIYLHLLLIHQRILACYPYYRVEAGPSFVLG